MSETIKKYDEKGNFIYTKYPNGHEYWYEYDENDKCIYRKDYDRKENWWKFDKNGNRKEITEQEKVERKFRKQEKEFLSRESVMRFELMEL